MGFSTLFRHVTGTFRAFCTQIGLFSQRSTRFKYHLSRNGLCSRRTGNKTAKTQRRAFPTRITRKGIQKNTNPRKSYRQKLSQHSTRLPRRKKHQRIKNTTNGSWNTQCKQLRTVRWKSKIVTTNRPQLRPFSTPKSTHT